MNDGRPVRNTTAPLAMPISAATPSVSGMAKISGNPAFTTSAPKIMPAKATIDPIDRSNSPPIISMAAAMAKMPS